MRPAALLELAFSSPGSTLLDRNASTTCQARGITAATLAAPRNFLRENRLPMFLPKSPRWSPTNFFVDDVDVARGCALAAPRKAAPVTKSALARPGVGDCSPLCC